MVYKPELRERAMLITERMRGAAVSAEDDIILRVASQHLTSGGIRSDGLHPKTSFSELFPL